MKLLAVLSVLLSVLACVAGQGVLCNVCGDDYLMSKKSVKLSKTIIGQLGLGDNVSCGNVDALGKLKVFPENVCKVIQGFPSFTTTCGCILRSTPVAPVPVSPVAPVPVSPVAPVPVSPVAPVPISPVAPPRVAQPVPVSQPVAKSVKGMGGMDGDMKKMMEKGV